MTKTENVTLSAVEMLFKLAFSMPSTALRLTFHNDIDFAM